MAEREPNGKNAKRQVTRLTAASVAMSAMLVLGGVAPAMAQTQNGSTSCASTHRQGLQSQLTATAPSGALTSHFYNSTGYNPVFYGNALHTSWNGLTSSGSWTIYSPYDLIAASGFCAPKPS
ncbi:hypothetical protein AB1K54_16580 [Microbacterium sp. BWT-B31]|uniref:hypothetical protein n=1 Tax=Microbacterium sp. BWT-B31 TaxID=3232072 RepID=UPI0035278770